MKKKLLCLVLALVTVLALGVSAWAASDGLDAPRITGAGNTATGVKVTWNAVPGAAQYRVFYKTTGGWKKIADTASTNYTWTGAKSGTEYTFTVRCVDSAAKSYTSAYDKNGLSVTYEKRDWVADLAAAKSANQLLIVAASGTNAVVSFHQKDSGGTWREVFSANGFIGSGGLGKTVQGDKKTPVGVYHFTDAFGICADPGSRLPYTKVDASHWWVGDSKSAYYNRFVSTRTVKQDWSASSSEHLVDYPTVYNYVLALDYNRPAVANAGSAIFVHCSRTPGNPTNGCVAIPEKYMIQLLKTVGTGCAVIIDTASRVKNY